MLRAQSRGFTHQNHSVIHHPHRFQSDFNCFNLCRHRLLLSFDMSNHLKETLNVFLMFTVCRVLLLGSLAALPFNLKPEPDRSCSPWRSGRQYRRNVAQLRVTANSIKVTTLSVVLVARFHLDQTRSGKAVAHLCEA